MSDDKKDYKVGYRKPPLKGQFKKGQSGNPNGRPKSSSDMRENLQKVLDEKITIREGGKKKIINKNELLARRLVNDAANGKVSAFKEITKIIDTNAKPGLTWADIVEEAERLQALEKQ